MTKFFSNQTFDMDIWKHRELPIIETQEFDFFRCLEFQDEYYGKTISELHKGNLRVSRKDNRYSNLFPGQKLSYWADSPKTAKAEVRRWGAKNNILTFWAYDDGSSFIPTVYPAENLRIIDGIHFGFDEILHKIGNHEELNCKEKEFIDRIGQERPDCLAYRSEARKDGICFLFFEQGFKKLSLKKVLLRLGDKKGKNTAKVACAISSDYDPILEGYGYYFSPIAKVKYDGKYIESDEYILRKQVEEYSYEKIRGRMK